MRVAAARGAPLLHPRPPALRRAEARPNPPPQPKHLRRNAQLVAARRGGGSRPLFRGGIDPRDGAMRRPQVLPRRRAPAPLQTMPANCWRCCACRAAVCCSDAPSLHNLAVAAPVRVAQSLIIYMPPMNSSTEILYAARLHATNKRCPESNPAPSVLWLEHLSSGRRRPRHLTLSPAGPCALEVPHLRCNAPPAAVHCSAVCGASLPCRISFRCLSQSTEGRMPGPLELPCRSTSRDKSSVAVLLV